MRSLIVDDRCGPHRRGLGPLGWLLLEEVALAAGVDGSGALIAELSVRSVAGRLGVGKQAAARALRSLSEAGTLIRLPDARQPGGGFGRARYLVILPEGLAVSDGAVPRSAVSIDTGRAVEDKVGADRGARHGGAHSAVPTSQACLFEAGPGDDGARPAACGSARRDGRGPVGPPSPDGCESDSGGHELAPGVPVRVARDGGDRSC